MTAQAHPCDVVARKRGRLEQPPEVSSCHLQEDDPVDLAGHAVLRDVEVEPPLQGQPQLCRGTEVLAETQRGVARPRCRPFVIDDAPWSDYSRAPLLRGLTYAVGRDVIQGELRRAGATIGSLSFGPPPPRPFDDDGGALVFDVYWVGDARPSRLDIYRGAPPIDRLLMRWHAVPSQVRAAVADELVQHWLPFACAWAADAPHRGNVWAATDHRWMVVRTGESLRLAEDRGDG